MERVRMGNEEDWGWAEGPIEEGKRLEGIIGGPGGTEEWGS